MEGRPLFILPDRVSTSNPNPPGHNAPESVAAEPSTKKEKQAQTSGSEKPTNSDKGKGKEEQTPHPPVSEHHVHAANLPVKAQPQTSRSEGGEPTHPNRSALGPETPGPRKFAAEPSTETGKERQSSGSEKPTNIDHKGKGKEKQTPHSPERSGSVSEHVPGANLPDSYLTHQGHPASSGPHLTHQGHPASGSVPQSQLKNLQVHRNDEGYLVLLYRLQVI